MAHDPNSAKLKAAKIAHETANTIIQAFGHKSEVVFNVLCEQPYQVNIHTGDVYTAKTIQAFLERHLEYPINIVLDKQEN